MSREPMHLRIGVVIFPQVLGLDFLGPLDVLRSLSPERLHPSHTNPPYSAKCVVLAETLDPVTMSGGLKVVPDMTFKQAVEEGGWNVVLVPGGNGSRPWVETNRAARDFLTTVVPECKYVLTVCTGSWLLASIGLLSGRKATTNKAAFKLCVEHNKDQGVTWVPKARWVVDDKYWTSSGVTAGIDMTSAFLRHFVGLFNEPEKAKEISDRSLGILEVSSVGPDDDEWAEYYGLV